MSVRESTIIGEAQSKNLETKILDITRDADLNLNGFNYNSLRKKKIVSNDVGTYDYVDVQSAQDFITKYETTKKNTRLDSKIASYSDDTTINRALYWFASESGDYGKNNSTKGANLKQYIGKILNSSNLQEWGEWLKDRFNEEFQDLQIVELRLMVDRSTKTLYIFFAVYNRTHNTTTTGAGAVQA